LLVLRYPVLPFILSLPDLGLIALAQFEGFLDNLGSHGESKHVSLLVRLCLLPLKLFQIQLQLQVSLEKLQRVFWLLKLIF